MLLKLREDTLLLSAEKKEAPEGLEGPVSESEDVCRCMLLRKGLSLLPTELLLS